MNITPSQIKVLIVIVRLAGVELLFNAVISFTYVLERLLYAMASPAKSLQQYYLMEVGLLFFRVVLEIALGIIFLTYAGAIVEKLSKGLDEEVQPDHQIINAPLSSPE